MKWKRKDYYFAKYFDTINYGAPGKNHKYRGRVVWNNGTYVRKLHGELPNK